MTDQHPNADLVAALAALREVARTGRAAIADRRPYTYMELPDLLQAVRQTMAGHRIGVLQQLASDGAQVTVRTVLVHASGHEWTSDGLTIRTRGGGAQEIGSAATYARRYSLAAFVGLAGDDDDDGATQQNTPTPTIERIPPPRDHTRGSVAKGSVTIPQRKLFWALLRETGMDEASQRGWVAEVLGMEGTDWHTADLSAYQVSQVIDRLRATLPPPPEDGAP